MRAHAGVADEDRAVVGRVLVQQVEGAGPLLPAARVVAPQALVGAVVEVEVHQVLELGARGREQLLAAAHVLVHRTADVEEQQHLDRVVALRAEMQVEPAGVARGAVDGGVEVEFLGRALARELAQLAQRHGDVARAQLDRIVEVGVVAPLPHLDRAALAAAAADAHALGVVAGVAEGRGAGGADPLRAAAVARLLLLEPLLQRAHQLVPVAERADPRLLLVAEQEFGLASQPFLRNLGQEVRRQGLDALEVGAEHAVVEVVARLVLDQAGARERVELVELGRRDAGAQGAQQAEELGGADRQSGRTQREEESDEHGWKTLVAAGCETAPGALLCRAPARLRGRGSAPGGGDGARALRDQYQVAKRRRSAPRSTPPALGPGRTEIVQVRRPQFIMESMPCVPR